MNEVQLIRSQLAAEREHLKATASLLAGVKTRESDSISSKFTNACAHYIVYSINKERGRGAAHLERSDARAQGQSHRIATEHAAERLRNALAACAPALARLRAALDAPSAGSAASEGLSPLARCAALAEQLIESQLALEALAEPSYTVNDWRRVANVDADSILEERRLHAEVLQHGPHAAVR